MFSMIKLLSPLLLSVVVSQAFAQPEKAAVKVCHSWYEDDKDGQTHHQTGYGSGSVIWSGKDKNGDECSIILTNSHVAPEDGDYDIITYRETPARKHRCLWLAATPEKDRDELGDLALLKCFVKLPTVKFANSDAPSSAKVTEWAFPRAGRLTKLEGTFRGEYGPGGNKFAYADYLTEPGSSGGGVYYKDELVAISFGITNKTDNDGNTLRDVTGKPIFTTPAWLVPHKKIEVFLNKQLPKEMSNEKPPSGPRPCDAQSQRKER